MKIKWIYVAILTFVPCVLYASKLAPLRINKLEEESKHIYIVKTINLREKQETSSYGKQVSVDFKVVSCLKGDDKMKEVNLILNHGGLKGFNTIPLKNSYWIIFLGNLKDKKGSLVHPRSMVKFDPPIIDK